MKILGVEAKFWWRLLTEWPPKDHPLMDPKTKGENDDVRPVRSDRDETR